jgi:hypothetical protein
MLENEVVVYIHWYFKQYLNFAGWSWIYYLQVFQIHSHAVAMLSVQKAFHLEAVPMTMTTQ